MEGLKKANHKIFGAKTVQTKRKHKEIVKQLRLKIADELHELGAMGEDEAQAIANWDMFDQNKYASFFDSEWMFGVSDGFDIVIGNPPYIQLQENGGFLANKYEHYNFESFTRTGDIYCLFYEQGCKLLKQKGILCYITSNKWMRTEYGRKLRSFFVKKNNPILLVDFGGIKIFESASVDTNILLIVKEQYTFNTKSCTIPVFEASQLLKDYFSENFLINSFDANNIWSVLEKIEINIRNKVERIGVRIKDLDIKINRGLLTGLNKAFIIDEKTKNNLISIDEKSSNIIFPILRGKDIKPYGYEFDNLWIINTHNGLKKENIDRIDVNNYPAIKKHLDQFYNRLKDRYDKGETPYNLRNCAYLLECYKPKIMYSEIVRQPQFYFDKEGVFIPEASAFMLTGEHLDYLYRLLHSRPLTFFFKRFYAGGGLGEKGYRYKKVFLENLPIPKWNNSELQNCIIESDSTDDIDLMVAQLYDLSSKEIDYINKNVGF